MAPLNEELNSKKIFLFWLPLALTWLMMAVEGPFLTSLIARLPDPKYNLAAYGVAFSFALIIESPVIMMMSASIALVKNKLTFNKLRKFTYTLNSTITLIFAVMLLPPIFYFVTLELINLPNSVAELTHNALIMLLPWPAAIGYRRFYQGILISNNLTRRVAYGTIIRLLTMGTTSVLLFTFTEIPGAVVGAVSLSSAVVMEAIASRLMSFAIVKKLKSDSLEFSKDHSIRYREIFSFYYPLAIMSLLNLGVQPFVTFFIGQSKYPLESYAVLPVITSFLFIFRSLGLSYQEVIVALIGDKGEGYEKLKKFGIALGLTLAGTLTIIAYTPLSDLWFKGVAGLSNELSGFAKFPLMIISVFPMLTVLISFQRALLVSNRYTKPISIGTFAEFAGIIIVLFIAIKYFYLVGAVAATMSFLIGRILANIYLTFPTKKALHQIKKT
jgi:Na+-driven multidrug efflux pump